MEFTELLEFQLKLEIKSQFCGYLAYTLKNKEIVWKSKFSLSQKSVGKANLNFNDDNKIKVLCFITFTKNSWRWVENGNNVY